MIDLTNNLKGRYPVMEKQYFNLMQFFDGYVRNYRRMNLTQLHNFSMFTKREIDYFANLGEMLGFDAYIEDSKFDKVKRYSRPMDLSWWKWDRRIDDEYFVYLALHLERENVCNKDVDTIEKLFSETEEDFVPHNVIGIQSIESKERIEYLNKMLTQKNAVQNSNVLMVYHLFDPELEGYRIFAYYFLVAGKREERNAICKTDELGYWYMCFEEEYETLRGGL